MIRICGYVMWGLLAAAASCAKDPEPRRVAERTEPTKAPARRRAAPAALGRSLAAVSMGRAAPGAKDAEVPKPRPTLCRKLCGHTVGKCLKHVVLASGKLSKSEYARYSKLPGAKGKIKAKARKGCLQRCRKAQKRGIDPARVEACLKLKKCPAYMKCIQALLK